MDKKRVLLMSEAHYLNSGFGTYANELLTRLHKTGKYELAEFASYGRIDAVKNKDASWLFYGNLPEDNNKSETDTYNSHPAHQFGIWRFEKVCLDFKPDIVLSYRDPWMDNWLQQSPLRKYFHWVWMPTVDSAPQRQEWINVFAECDAILTYSEFGGEVLKNQGKERINYIGCASPGIDPEIYKPIPKNDIRDELELDRDCFIVGTVMRNQKRKLFFELMKSFRLFLDKAPYEISSKTFLYLHTSYPEKVGWNIAEGIMENSLGGKVLMTYICRNCHRFFPYMFQDALAKCKFCGQFSAVCPTVALGLSIPDLAKIYNAFDIYVQYAICEGFGMPQVEAGACGVPVAATDYSAMRDVVKFTKGYPIPVRTFFREMETNAERAYPDNEVLAEILINFFKQDDSSRIKKSMEVRKHTIKRYNWNDTAKVWEDYIDSYQPIGLQGKWNAPAQITQVPEKIPENLSKEQFIQWLFFSVLQEPERINKIEGINLFRSLKFSAHMGVGTLEPVNIANIFTEYKQRAISKNQAESLRVGNPAMIPDKFIIQSHERVKKQQA
tara:strand:+ start:2531 stop:4192 length:1662 start_codon:yes stop_codon:yes gene_type:complete